MTVALTHTKVTDRSARQWRFPTSGVKQGCPLSPLVYTFFHEMLLYLIRQVLSDVLVGDVSYIDDTTVVFTCEEDVRLGGCCDFRANVWTGVEVEPC